MATPKKSCSSTWTDFLKFENQLTFSFHLKASRAGPWIGQGPQRAAWAVANDAGVVENVRTASMMVRMSRVEIVICCKGARRNTICRGGTGVRGPEKTKGSGAGGIGVRGGDTGIEGAGA